jgi:3-phenylpropionate/cinnamic acid dioxygenase small subunit
MVETDKSDIGTKRAKLEDVLLQREIEQFFYDEAALLDSRKFHEWLTLLADDLEYWMPVRSTRQVGDEEFEFTKLGESALFDDNKEFIEERVRKLDTGYSWSEDPPSRSRHFVSNVRILEQRSKPEELDVSVNFFIYRSRLASDEDMWIGRREDTLRKVDGQWQISRRHIFLDQVSLGSKNLSVFF